MSPSRPYPEGIVKEAPKRRLYPWQKEAADLNKFDWMTAVGISERHRNSPRDLRVAAVMLRLADQETNYVWATQETIAKLAGLADGRQVRASMERLEGAKGSGGALRRSRIGDLQPDMVEQLDGRMNARNRRGVVYKLSMFWAYEVFEGYGKAARREPSQLRKGKATKRTAPVRYDRTAPVRYEADYVSPAYIEEDIPSDINSGRERKEDLASTREGNAYATAKGRAA